MVIHRATKTNIKPSRLNSMVNRLRNVPLNRLFAAMKEPVKAELNAFQLEQLEPRLLLSADPLSALALSSAADITLQVSSVNNQQVIQLIDNTPATLGTVLASQALSSIAAGSIITINGSDEADKFSINQSFLDLGERNFVIKFDGQAGDDTIATDSGVIQSAWQIHGEKTGSLGTNGIIEFANAETLNVTQSSDSNHVIAALNNSYSWKMSAQGAGVVSILEDVAGTDLDNASGASLAFSGFDVVGGSGTDYLDYSSFGSAVTVNLEEEIASGLS